MDKIEVIGARVHNLDGVDVTIPRNKLVVVTGLSGSGKSSLAFDTIYAEGQRRYMETLSAYARQFIGILERPAVDSITGLSPIIAIEQKTTGKNPRSTVGTITEIYDFLRLLYARASVAYSPATGKPMIKYTNEQIISLILDDYAGKKCIILSPLVVGRKGHYKELFDNLLKKGYTQIRVDGKLYSLSEIKPLDRYKIHFIELVVDKLIPSNEDYKRISNSVQTAIEQGKGTLAILDMEKGEESDLRYFSKQLMCPVSGISFPEPAPHNFSFNSPQGACPKCKGLGIISKIDLSKVIPDKNKSIFQGGIEPLGSYKDNNWFRILDSMAKKYNFSLNTPIKDLPEDIIDMIINGTEELFRVRLSDGTELASFPGILSKIEQQENEEINLKKERFVEEVVCPECNGTRLKKDVLYFKIDNKDISQISDMDIDTLYNWVVVSSKKIR
jgi:Excinuclease ATPase subunit